MITTTPNTSFEALLTGAPSGTHWWVTLKDGQGGIILARSDTGIVEEAPGVYTATVVAPATIGVFTLIWDDGTRALAEQLIVSDVVTATELCTVQDVRDADEALTNVGPARNPHIQAVIQDASAMISMWTGRAFTVDAVPATVRRACVQTVVHWLRADRALTQQSPDQWEPGAPPQRMLPMTALDLLRMHKLPGIA